MTEQNIKKLIEKIFDINLADFENSQIAPENIELWDSIGHLNLVTSIEEETGLNFEPEEVTDMLLGVDKIIEIVTKKYNK